MTDPFASVVTARDVYDATRETQADVRHALTRIDQHDRALDEIRRDQERAETEHAAEHQVFRSRLDAIDRWRYAMPVTAIAAVIAAVGSVATAIFT